MKSKKKNNTKENNRRINLVEFRGWIINRVYKVDAPPVVVEPVACHEPASHAAVRQHHHRASYSRVPWTCAHVTLMCSHSITGELRS